MALATTCPQCKTSFKVVPDQLKLRRGLVRCGVCQHVFSGIDYLRYVSDPKPATPAPHSGDSPTDLKTAFFLPETVLGAEPATYLAPASIRRSSPPVDDIGPIVEPHPYQPPIPSSTTAAAWSDAAAEDSSRSSGTDRSTPTEELAPREPADGSPARSGDEATHAPADDDSRRDDHVEQTAHRKDGTEASRAGVEWDPYEDPLSTDSLDAQAWRSAAGDLRAEAEDPAFAPAPGMFVSPGGHERINRGEGQAPGLDGQVSTEQETGTDSSRGFAGGLVSEPTYGEALHGANRGGTRDRNRAGSGFDAFDAALGADETDAVDFFSTGSGRVASFDGFTPLALMAAVLLVVLLGVQLAVGSRDELGARFPSARPVLAALASAFGLEVDLPRRPGAITIDSFELTATSTNSVYALNALLRNHATYPVRWPAIELTLTDSVGAVLVRRVLAPDEYLSDVTEIDKGIPAAGEHPLRVSLQTQSISPSGYSAVLFYP